MAGRIAKLISLIFHPVLLPTLGMFLLFKSGFYFSMLSWEAMKYILLVVFLSTCILPLLAVAGMAFSPNFDIAMENHRQRMFPLIMAAFFYFLGYMLMAKINAFQIFRIFMLSSVVVLLLLTSISYHWKISNHSAALGGLTATLIALSFRTGNNPVWPIVIVLAASGLVGTSRLILGKHSLAQVLAGYGLSFTVFYIAVYFF
jgi:membrane-associated phospholipid phosphatase